MRDHRLPGFCRIPRFRRPTIRIHPLRPLLTSLLLLFLPHTAHAAEEVLGDVTFLAGGAWPQGSTSKFSDAGWNLNLRVAAHLPFLKGVIPTLSFGTAFFPGESGLVEDETENFIVIAKQETDRWAGAVNLGIQLGSPSRRGFFRPRAGIAPGFYLLGAQIDRTLPQDPEPYYQSTLLLGRLGWKGVIGADLFFTRSAGLSLEFVYDQIWHIENRQSGRYQGFAVGITVATESAAFDSEPEPEGQTEGVDETDDRQPPTDE